MVTCPPLSFVRSELRKQTTTGCAVYMGLADHPDNRQFRGTPNSEVSRTRSFAVAIWDAAMETDVKLSW